MQKLESATLVELAAQQIVELIAEKELKAGDTLPSIQELSMGFDVSRTVIREAFRSLEAHGIIEVANGKRATIKAVSSKPLLTYFNHVIKIEINALSEFIEVRKGLEIHSASLAATNHTDEDMAEIHSLMNRMREEIDDLEVFTEIDVELHLAIARATHNTMLFHLIQSVRSTIRQTIHEGRRRRTDEQLSRVIELHEALVEAVASGNPQNAKDAMEQHFDEIAISVGHLDDSNED